MTLPYILLLILLGLLLLIMEILFVPGMVLGFISLILMMVGIIFSYKDYGTTTGTIVLAGTVLASAAAIYRTFKSNVWSKMGVQSKIDGKANAIAEDAVKVGDSGKTISRLNPIGRAYINNLDVEVQAQDDFIDQEKDIVVIHIRQNKIIVKLS